MPKIAFLFLLIPVFLLSSCHESPAPSILEDKKDIQNLDAKVVDTSSLIFFIRQFQENQPALEIPTYLCDQYIKAALEKDTLFPYILSEETTYSYGQIGYEDNQLVALVFYYKSIHLLNDLSASFVATYRKLDGAFVDCKMLFGSGIFNSGKTGDYGTGFSYKTDIVFVKNPKVIYQLHSTKESISNYNQPVSKQKSTISKLIFELNQDGVFSLINK